MSESDTQRTAVDIVKLRELARRPYDAPIHIREVQDELCRVRDVLDMFKSHIKNLHTQKVILERMISSAKRYAGHERGE